ncbi:MAG TPA: hypothetical protein VJ883_06710 [Woeseiaceae bacterium]|nr:hypothetical protein [Woeseiaceae bacterium]
MQDSPDSTFGRLDRELHRAMTAEVPDLRVVRERQERLIDYLFECVLRQLEDNDEEDPDEPRFRVIETGSPRRTPRRGVSSPVKTAEMQRFEAAVREVFGDIRSSWTTWERA